jgi:hypothetical protein
MIQETQVSLNQKAVFMLRIVLTLWTAHFLAYCHLLKLRQSLDIIVTQEENQPECEKLIIKGRCEVKEHGQKLFQLIQNPVFWHSLAMQVDLKPTRLILEPDIFAG